MKSTIHIEHSAGDVASTGSTQKGDGEADILAGAEPQRNIVA
jgi:hypothetical protein